MRIVVLSDLHFGHKKIPGDHIYKNLKTYVYPKLESADLLVITGDIFHSLLDFNNEASGYIIQFLNEIFYFSKKYGFGIRILRGTFSHDRNQIEYIKQSAYRQGDSPIQLKTYTDITLEEEYIKGEYLKCLYLPDDLPYSSQEEVLEVVYKLLDDRKWLKVDIIFGHGYFQHVLPTESKSSMVIYTIEALSSICNSLMVFGHVHTPSVRRYGHVTALYVGSFERMRHGEEERKGFIGIDTQSWRTTFYTNSNTLKFLTFRTDTTDIDRIVEEFKHWIDISHLSKVHTNYIRVIHSTPDVRILLGKILRSEFPQYKCVYTSESTSMSTSIVLNNEAIESGISLIPPTEDNIIDLIEKTIKNKGLPTLSRDRIEKIWSLQFDEDVYGSIE